MSLNSALQNLKRRRLYRKIRKGKQPVNDLPPYERGLYYEDFACRWLKSQGYKILDRNYHGRKRSEIDIIAKDGKTLVFIEVKARRRLSVYTPLRAINRKKRTSIALASAEYLRELELTGIDTEDLDVRYDVIALAFDQQGIPSSLDHYISYLVPQP